ncbi:MAG: hypothetical protein RRB13_09145 [bacterium]|nr:hypothetical protein [bacterium]
MKIYKFYPLLLGLLALALVGCKKEEAALDATSDAADNTVSEGSTTSPILLSNGQSRDGSVSSADYSYYRLVVTESGSYDLDLTIPDGQTLSVYGSDFQNFNFLDAFLLRTCNQTSSCKVILPNLPANYNIDFIIQSNESASFTMTLSKGFGQGTIGDGYPVELGQTVLAGIDNGTIKANQFAGSLYHFKTGPVGGSYHLLDQAHIALSWEVIKYPEFSSFYYDEHQPNTAVKSHEAMLERLDASTDYYLLAYADNQPSDQFTFTLQKAYAEGSLSYPVALTLDSTHDATFDASLVSSAYYSFTATASSHTITTVNSADRFKATLYDTNAGYNSAHGFAVTSYYSCALAYNLSCTAPTSFSGLTVGRSYVIHLTHEYAPSSPLAYQILVQ